jgi:hypothetical protein
VGDCRIFGRVSRQRLVIQHARSSFSTNLVSSVTPSSRAGIVAGQTRRAEVAGYILANVRFSNRPFRVKRFQTPTIAVSMSLVGSRFSSGSAPWPFPMGFEDEVEQSLGRPLPSDERQVPADMRTHRIHHPARDITVALDQ